MNTNELLELIARLSSKIESKEDYINWMYKQQEDLQNRIKDLEEELLSGNKDADQRSKKV